MRTSHLKSLATLLALVFCCQASAGGELVVIVSAKNTVSSLRADQVADIFLGQMASFPGGAEAVALDQRIGSPERNEFYTKVAAKSPPLVKAYWSKMIFTGRGQPPKEVADSAAIRKMVAENPHLIGYIERSALDPSVKAVLVVR